jgi:hypothetical protein
MAKRKSEPINWITNERTVKDGAKKKKDAARHPSAMIEWSRPTKALYAGTKMQQTGS